MPSSRGMSSRGQTAPTTAMAELVASIVTDKIFRRGRASPRSWKLLGCADIIASMGS